MKTLKESSNVKRVLEMIIEDTEDNNSLELSRATLNMVKQELKNLNKQKINK